MTAINLKDHRNIAAYLHAEYTQVNLPMHASKTLLFIANPLRPLFGEIITGFKSNYQRTILLKQLSRIYVGDAPTSLTHRQHSILRMLPLEEGCLFYLLWDSRRYIHSICLSLDKKPRVRLSVGLGHGYDEAENYGGYAQKKAWPVPGHKKLNSADKPGEGDGAFGSCRGGDCTRSHRGIDIEAPVGSDVVAFADGAVVAISPNPSRTYGNQVVIDHGNGVFSQSAHLGTLNVKPGDLVKVGQLIGTVGRTGNTPVTGDAHLHFEIRIGGKLPVAAGGTTDDPMKYLP